MARVDKIDGEKKIDLMVTYNLNDDIVKTYNTLTCKHLR